MFKISVLSALAIISQAAPTPDTIEELSDLMERSNSCLGDNYFKCITFYAQLCNTVHELLRVESSSDVAVLECLCAAVWEDLSERVP
ncbi:hypothetical protein E4U17_000389 [Claviceps sp. LM77 group G4]|nr:hypothetical protein E4U17_000389 [Claviceps sp. LM77 group G4]KAG6081662.1 hypothetical protein E4U33_006605 [Claviceps sp. LM78 group G4]KAG6082791.1 hypothetical protein E4U16_005530 [Claviceps sp. LM84 group G4]